MRRVLTVLALATIGPATLLAQGARSSVVDNANAASNWKALGASHGISIIWAGPGTPSTVLDTASIRVLGPDHFVATTQRTSLNSPAAVRIEYDCASHATRLLDAFSWREANSTNTPQAARQQLWARPAPGSRQEKLIAARCDLFRQRTEARHDGLN